MLKALYYFLESITVYAIYLFETIGVLVMVYAGLKGVYNLLKRNPHTGVELAKSMATALQFKLGGEILRTVIIREMNEILLVGGIILLRSALTLLIHWELRNSATQEAIIQQKKEEPQTEPASPTAMVSEQQPVAFPTEDPSAQAEPLPRTESTEPYHKESLSCE